MLVLVVSVVSLRVWIPNVGLCSLSVSLFISALEWIQRRLRSLLISIILIVLWNGLSCIGGSPRPLWTFHLTFITRIFKGFVTFICAFCQRTFVHTFIDGTILCNLFFADSFPTLSYTFMLIFWFVISVISSLTIVF